MAIRVALNHLTRYDFDRPVSLSPHVVRLRPAPHCRTPVTAYSMKVRPGEHFENWQQDPHGNFLARLVFPNKVRSLEFEVDLVAEMTVVNPFDFFLEPQAEKFPFEYDPDLRRDLEPYHVVEAHGPLFEEYFAKIDTRKRKTVDFLVELNQQLENDVDYLVRMEPGVQTCEQTLTRRSGSCRDSAWLMVQILRRLGFAARFVSGYLIQLVGDVKPLDGPEGPTADFTDLHAWTEVYLPGAGWVGLDPTSGLLAGEGHVPLACTPHPISAAPVTGAVDECETEFTFRMNVTRVHEDPRVTKPYTDEEWSAIRAVGDRVDEALRAGDVRLTMGGEPTFVSIDDMDGAEWNTEADGPTKRHLANDLLHRLADRFAYGALLHHGQGKWYPGEQLPRWAFGCYWRHDGEPIWRDRENYADLRTDYGHGFDEAQALAAGVAERLGVGTNHLETAYEDAYYYMWRERRLPVNVDVRDAKLDDKVERDRIARVFEQGLNTPVGVVLPLKRFWWEAGAPWKSGPWPVRPEVFFLIPGDSAMGYRLPLDALPFLDKRERLPDSVRDPLEAVPMLPPYEMLRRPHVAATSPAYRRQFAHVGGGEGGNGDAGRGGDGPGDGDNGFHDPSRPPYTPDVQPNPPSDLVRTALCVEPRQGRLHVFMPPADRLEDYLEVVSAVEETAEALGTPVVLEGYTPPRDPRANHIGVTPDPGVIEVNVHPAHDWSELVDVTTGVYEDARQTRLGTEKFDLDGTHTGTGGGNHVVLGGPTPADSPFLRRPDLLKSLLAYWHNHPSLSYLFSGKFVGPTSQAPRVDEGRRDARYELQIAFEQVRKDENVPPWLVDRVFRDLLVDVTGNTHRAEFCIDKLYSPDTSSGRLGLVEFRAFEMPPHARMSVAQQLLLRSLVARFWEQPYEIDTVDWNTTLHDRFLLPHFVWRDFQDVVGDVREAGFEMDDRWFRPHFEFRFPRIGGITRDDVELEIRSAIEPWYVLGEDGTPGGTARYVDSSVERLEVRLRGMVDPRHAVTCNGRRLPLHPTGREGEFVSGVRYRAWQPPRCLHPTITVDAPLVFDVLDTWNRRSLGGCEYHVGHPGGLNPETFPVNAAEAESRRATRFFERGHTPGFIPPPPIEENAVHPLTLDLRRNGE